MSKGKGAVSSNGLTFIDLFAGAGGLSEGLSEAGFECLLSNEIVPEYARTYQKNHPSAKVLTADIRTLDPDMIREELGLEKGQIDLIAGGPPCQGFSINAPVRSANDERNHLFREYLRFVEAFGPKAVLIENVPGLVSFEDGATLHTTGNYRTAREKLLQNREITKDTVGFNWENVAKRIIPQIIYKGQILQREDLCKTGLYFVCPEPVYERVLARLGGKERLPVFPTQPASIHFVSYDYIDDVADATVINYGTARPLDLIEEHITTVYKVQEAFSALNLPNGNVYRDAIMRSLFD